MPRFICERCRTTTDAPGRCPSCGYHEVLDADAPDTELWLEVNDAMCASVGERIGAFLRETAGVIGFAMLFAVPAAFYAAAPAASEGWVVADLCLMPSVVLLTYLLLDPLATVLRWFAPSLDEVAEEGPDAQPEPVREERRSVAARKASSRQPVPGLER